MAISDTLSETNWRLKKDYVWYCVTSAETFRYEESVKKEVRDIITRIENLRSRLDTPPDYEPVLIEEWFPSEDEEY